MFHQKDSANQTQVGGQSVRRQRSRFTFLHTWYDSPLAKALFLLSAAVSLISGCWWLTSIFHRNGYVIRTQPSQVASNAPSAFTSKQKLSVGRLRETTQVAKGIQSPNVSSVGGSVGISYDSPRIGTAPQSKKRNTAAAPAPNSTIQVSLGARSPNISGVTGDVDVTYGAAATGQSADGAAERKR